MCKDKEGKTYIIEINGNPGTKIIDITGHNYFLDLVDHIEDKVGKKKKQDDNKEASYSGQSMSDTEAKSFLAGLRDKYKIGTANTSTSAKTKEVSEIDQLRKKHSRLMEGL